MKIADHHEHWRVNKIGVIGPGIVGMPMAGMLAHARIRIGQDQPAKVLVVQRDSVSSGWKVGAINQGKSVIGGIEPELDEIVETSVSKGILSAAHDFEELSDADVILISVQTDKKGNEPDYGPLFGALEKLAKALQNKPTGNIPLIIFESTLAPTSMLTLIKDHFAAYGLQEGEDILLGNSPNRVMPGRLVERIRTSDKLIGGLTPLTPQLIERIYQHIVKEGKLYKTNSLTAEIVKTLENAYRDVRIALSAEIVRFCDAEDINYYQLRDRVNSAIAQEDAASGDPNAVPSGGLLIPTVGVGGHCLPKDGILLWWRLIEAGVDTTNSLIMNARKINDASPANTLELAEKKFGTLTGKKIALLGTAYRFNSEDTRNSPSLNLAKLMQEKQNEVILHDPYVKENDQNLIKFELTANFTNELKRALDDAELIFMCTSHKDYMEQQDQILDRAAHNLGIVDGCNIYQPGDFTGRDIAYTGIGRGRKEPDAELVEQFTAVFKMVETGLANELQQLIDFYNVHHVHNEYNRVAFSEVQRLAKSCSTGCEIANTGTVRSMNLPEGFRSLLFDAALKAGNDQ